MDPQANEGQWYLLFLVALSHGDMLRTQKLPRFWFELFLESVGLYNKLNNQKTGISPLFVELVWSREFQMMNDDDDDGGHHHKSSGEDTSPSGNSYQGSVMWLTECEALLERSSKSNVTKQSSTKRKSSVGLSTEVLCGYDEFVSMLRKICVRVFQVHRAAEVLHRNTERAAILQTSVDQIDVDDAVFFTNRTYFTRFVEASLLQPNAVISLNTLKSSMTPLANRLLHHLVDASLDKLLLPLFHKFSDNGRMSLAQYDACVEFAFEGSPKANPSFIRAIFCQVNDVDTVTLVTQSEDVDDKLELDEFVAALLYIAIVYFADEVRHPMHRTTIAKIWGFFEVLAERLNCEPPCSPPHNLDRWCALTPRISMVYPPIADIRVFSSVVVGGVNVAASTPPSVMLDSAESSTTTHEAPDPLRSTFQSIAQMTGRISKRTAVNQVAELAARFSRFAASGQVGDLKPAGHVVPPSRILEFHKAAAHSGGSSARLRETDPTQQPTEQIVLSRPSTASGTESVTHGVPSGIVSVIPLLQRGNDRDGAPLSLTHVTTGASTTSILTPAPPPLPVSEEGRPVELTTFSAVGTPRQSSFRPRSSSPLAAPRGEPPPPNEEATSRVSNEKHHKSRDILYVEGVEAETVYFASNRVRMQIPSSIVMAPVHHYTALIHVDLHAPREARSMCLSPKASDVSGGGGRRGGGESPVDDASLAPKQFRFKISRERVLHVTVRSRDTNEEYNTIPFIARLPPNEASLGVTNTARLTSFFDVYSPAGRMDESQFLAACENIRVLSASLDARVRAFRMFSTTTNGDMRFHLNPHTAQPQALWGPGATLKGPPKLTLMGFVHAIASLFMTDEGVKEQKDEDRGRTKTVFYVVRCFKLALSDDADAPLTDSLLTDARSPTNAVMTPRPPPAGSLTFGPAGEPIALPPTFVDDVAYQRAMRTRTLARSAGHAEQERLAAQFRETMLSLTPTGNFPQPSVGSPCESLIRRIGLDKVQTLQEYEDVIVKKNVYDRKAANRMAQIQSEAARSDLQAVVLCRHVLH